MHQFYNNLPKEGSKRTAMSVRSISKELWMTFALKI
jgi:hypothetical protein